MSIEEDFVIINLDESELEKETNLDNILTDEAFAKELQAQFNREYNNSIQGLEELHSGSTKVNVSYEKYKKYDNYEDNDEIDSDLDDDWNKYDTIDRTFNPIPPCYGMITKHDVSLNGLRNMKKLMSLPPNVQTGDGSSSNVEISNRVLNGLKHHSQVKMSRENNRYKEKEHTKDRILDKPRRICLMGVDQSTNEIVQSLINGQNACLQSVSAKVADGVEAMIYRAEKIRAYPYYYDKHYNNHCIIKLFKLDSYADNYYGYYYIPRVKYLVGDPRYSHRYKSKMSKFSVACLWAEKERDNLALLKKCMIPCPEVIYLKNNVLVMSLIGDDEGRPAKPLQDIKMTMNGYQLAYEQIVQNMTIMYKRARLVHANLSAHHILWFKKQAYLIDLSHAVHVSHANSLEFLQRDCNAIIDFFDKKQLAGTMTKEQLFKHITGIDYNDSNSIACLPHKERLNFKQHCQKDALLPKKAKIKLVGV